MGSKGFGSPVAARDVVGTHRNAKDEACRGVGTPMRKTVVILLLVASLAGLAPGVLSAPAQESGCTPCECQVAHCEGGRTWWPTLRDLAAPPTVDPGENATISFRVDLVDGNDTYPDNATGWSGVPIRVVAASHPWNGSDWSAGRVDVVASIEVGNNGTSYQYPRLPAVFVISLPARESGELHVRVKVSSQDWSEAMAIRVEPVAPAEQPAEPDTTPASSNPARPAGSAGVPLLALLVAALVGDLRQRAGRRDEAPA